MGNYAVITLHREKSRPSIRGLERHIEREGGIYSHNHELRPELSALNYHFISPAGKYNNLIDEKISEHGCICRSNSTLLVHAIISASYDYIIKKDVDYQRRLFLHALEFIKEKYGTDNILSAVVHLDENAPHLHAVFVPITRDGRLSASELVAKPIYEGTVQRDFFDHMKREFPEIDTPHFGYVPDSSALKPEVYKRAASMVLKTEELMADTRDMNMFNMEKKRERISESISLLMPEIVDLKLRLDASGKLIEQMRRDKDEMEIELDVCREKMRRKDSRIRELEQLKSQDELEITRLQKLLSLIPSDTRHEYLKGEKQFEDVFALRPREER